MRQSYGVVKLHHCCYCSSELVRTGLISDSCGEASPRVGVGNGEFDPLPSGNGAGNGESTAKDFYLFAYISNQKMIISGYT